MHYLYLNFFPITYTHKLLRQIGQQQAILITYNVTYLCIMDMINIFLTSTDAKSTTFDIAT